MPPYQVRRKLLFQQCQLFHLISFGDSGQMKIVELLNDGVRTEATEATEVNKLSAKGNDNASGNWNCFIAKYKNTKTDE